MKRILSVVCAVLVCGAMISCGTDDFDNSKQKNTSDSAVLSDSSVISTDSSCSADDETDEAEDVSDDDELAEIEDVSDDNESLDGDTSTSEENNRYAEIELEIAEDEAYQVKKVSLQGTFSDSTYISDVYNRNVLHTNLVGLFGHPVIVDSADSVKADIIFEYNADDMKCVPPENLIVLYYDENECFYNTVISELDVDNSTVTALITEPGAYMLADAYEWYGAWGDDVSKYAHDIEYKDSEYGFCITVPKEVQLKYVSYPLSDDDEGKYQVLLESYSNDVMMIGVEYLERPTYSNAQNYIDAMADIVNSNGALKSTGVINASGGTQGYYFYADFGMHNFSLNCVFPINSTQYINFWYGFTDESYYEKAIASLESFEFDNESAS